MLSNAAASAKPRSQNDRLDNARHGQWLNGRFKVMYTIGLIDHYRQLFDKILHDSKDPKIVSSHLLFIAALDDIEHAIGKFVEHGPSTQEYIFQSNPKSED